MNKFLLVLFLVLIVFVPVAGFGYAPLNISKDAGTGRYESFTVYLAGTPKIIIEMQEEIGVIAKANGVRAEFKRFDHSDPAQKGKKILVVDLFGSYEGILRILQDLRFFAKRRHGRTSQNP